MSLKQIFQHLVIGTPTYRLNAEIIPATVSHGKFYLSIWIQQFVLV